MRVGDLVEFFSDESDYAGLVGIVMGFDHCKVYGDKAYVRWPTAYIKYSQRQLVVVSEGG